MPIQVYGAVSCMAMSKSEHGSRSCYVGGCRQPECVAANTDYEKDRQWRARRRRPSASLRAMAELELAWLAGLLEGEGAFMLQHVPASSTQRARLRVKIALHMTDRDVVERVASIVGLGNVTWRCRQQEHHKDTYFWQVSSLANVVQLMKLLRPYMGERRCAQIDTCLEAVEAAGGVQDRRLREFRLADVV
jgi:LAGLIDADG endonuclease